MSQFTSVVDKRSRQKMVDFLRDHYRYDTMSSWNSSTSYAHCVKIHRLGLTSEQRDAAYAAISADDDHWQYEVRQIIADFTAKYSGGYTIGQNGRSGGYMVLYESHYEQSQYKSHCVSCGQMSYASIFDLSKMSQPEAELTKFMVAKGRHWTIPTVMEQSEVVAIDLPEDAKLKVIRRLKATDLSKFTIGNKCGRCGAEGERGRQPYSARELKVWSGRSIDMGADWDDTDEWTMSRLKSRVELVQDFDSAVQTIRDAFINHIENFEVVEETVMIPKTLHVTQPRGEV